METWSYVQPGALNSKGQGLKQVSSFLTTILIPVLAAMLVVCLPTLVLCPVVAPASAIADHGSVRAFFKLDWWMVSVWVLCVAVIGSRIAIGRGKFWRGIKNELSKEVLRKAPSRQSGTDSEGLSTDSPRSRKLKILLAEDNDVIQKLMCRILCKLGHVVHPTSDGHECLEAVEKGHYDMIFMDVQMPRVDGYAAVQRLRVAGKRIWITMLTSDPMGPDFFKYATHGIDDCMYKPCTIQQIEAAIERRLNGRSSAVHGVGVIAVT